ncbi:hypothetical protein SAMN05216504_3598 [Pseudomonas sp. A214]|nr:hypothetical protein SAMN05216504_3598 [Pseudomonas sp. A214]
MSFYNMLRRQKKKFLLIFYQQPSAAKVIKPVCKEITPLLQFFIAVGEYKPSRRLNHIALHSTRYKPSSSDQVNDISLRSQSKLAT